MTVSVYGDINWNKMPDRKKDARLSVKDIAS